MEIALAIAKVEKYEIQCLQVIPVPKYIYPAQSKVDASDARHMMHRLERLGRKAQVSVHTQVRVANSIPTAIIETIQQEQISLLITGWSGTNLSPDNIFGGIVDTLMEKVPCDLIVLKLSAKTNSFPYLSSLPNHHKQPRRWLIPTAGGENTYKLIKFLPGLASLDQSKNSPEINLCHVFRSFQHESSYKNLKHLSKEMINQTGLLISTLSIRDNSVPEAVMKLYQAHEYDFVILGGRNDDLLKNIMLGNISKEIIRQIPTTIMIFRSSN